MLNLIRFLILLGIQINVNQEKSEAVGLVWLDTQNDYEGIWLTTSFYTQLKIQ